MNVQTDEKLLAGWAEAPKCVCSGECSACPMCLECRGAEE